MEKFIMLIGILIGYVFITALPLYLVVNFVCWVFQISFHLSFIQAFALALLANVINKLLFRRKENK